MTTEILQRLERRNLPPELKSCLTELKPLLKEIEGRERAKTDLLTYVSSIEIPGKPVHPDDDDCEEFTQVETGLGAHHLLWIDCLQRVEDGEIPRLMGLMPPGSAKSTYTSVVFPTHHMGRFPNEPIIMGSYGSDLPKKFGRRGRSIVKQKQYRRIFDTELSPESGAADEWALTNGSEFMGVGFLAGVTGNRAMGLIWDDPIKGREAADSETIREKTWEAYFDDLLTRKKPGAWEIGITTRWHEDDLAGRILPEHYAGESGWIDCRDGNRWFVVCIPAEAERDDDVLGRSKGERVWPEWFPADHFEPFKRNSRSWNSLYQQRPAPEEGDYFRAGWFKAYDKLPARETLRVYGASDYAVTANGGDYTAHIVVGVDPEWRMYVLDLWRAQTDSAEWVESFCDLVLEHKPIEWAEETGQIRAGVGPFLTKTQIDRKAYVYRRGFPTKGDKAVRAQSIRGRMALHGLYLPVDATWVPAFKRELLTFPSAAHDDQVDALGLIGQLLDHIYKGSVPKEQKPTVWQYETQPGGQVTIGNAPIRELIKRQEKRLYGD